MCVLAVAYVRACGCIPRVVVVVGPGWRRHQVRMVDAPVSGGVGGAEAGTLTFMVGGSDDNFAAAKPILECMGANIVHCGDNGTGTQKGARAVRGTGCTSHTLSDAVRGHAAARPSRQAVQQPDPGHFHGRRV